MLVNDDNKIFLLFSAAGVELTNSFRENSFIKTSRINVFSAGYFFSTIIENFAAGFVNSIQDAKSGAFNFWVEGD